MFTMGLYVLKATNELNSARWYGKLCTGALYIVMMLHVIIPDLPAPISLGSLLACAVLMMFSLVMYMIMYMKILNKSENADKLEKNDK